MSDKLLGSVCLIGICALEFVLGVSFGNASGWSKGYKEGQNVGRLLGLTEAAKVYVGAYNRHNDKDQVD